MSRRQNPQGAILRARTIKEAALRASGRKDPGISSAVLWLDFV